MDQDIPYAHVDKLGGTTGEWATQGSRAENKASKPLAVKTYGGSASGQTARLTGEFVGEIPGALECAQGNPPGNQDQGSTWKGAIQLPGVGEVTESGARAEWAALLSLWHLSHI